MYLYRTAQSKLLEAEIMQAIEDPDKVEALLKKAATFNAFSRDTMGSFLVAAADATGIPRMRETTEPTQCRVIQILLEHGANINQINQRQQTALHIAALRGYTQMAYLLRNHKDIDITLTDRNGKTAMELARRTYHFLDNAIATNEGWDKVCPVVNEVGDVQLPKPSFKFK